MVDVKFGRYEVTFNSSAESDVQFRFIARMSISYYYRITNIWLIKLHDCVR